MVSAMILTASIGANARPAGWIVKVEPGRALNGGLARCHLELLNPHLGGDIYLARCANPPNFEGVEQEVRWKVQQKGLGKSFATTPAAATPARDFADPVVPRDPLNSDQWGFEVMNLASFWSSVSRGDARVTVAVIDTGVDYRHEDLAVNISVNGAEIPANGVDDDHNGYIDDYYGWDAAMNSPDLADKFDHGTHVMGVIGASTDNGVGVSGMNWRVSMVPVKFTDSNGGGSTASAIRAFDYAVARGAKIINVSWGGPKESPLLEEVLKRCRDLGILIVAAAGNEATDNDKIPTYPASYQLDNILSVAAIDLHQDLAYFSNWGAKFVHVAAPGASILSTIGGNKYGYKDGTSMAVPHIAGAAALLWAAHPEWTYRDVRAHIMNNCVSTPALRAKVACQGYFKF
jgi:subtilisin family serine protease